MNGEILTHPTYDMLHEGSVQLAHEVRERTKIDYIVALVRGGMFPALIMSHVLNDTPVIAAAYSSKLGAGDNKDHVNKLPIIENKTILIVDEISDTSKTLMEVVNFYEQYNCEVGTAVLYFKENTTGFEPHFYWKKIPYNSDWIVFPFEVK